MSSFRSVGVPFIVLAIPPVVGAVAFALAYSSSQQAMAAISSMRVAPRASLSSPHHGPALYGGVLEGPEGRMDQDGRRAAAHWWWVKEDVGEGDSTIWCFERHVDDMLLRDERGGVARLEMFANDTTVSLFAEDHANDRSAPIIDLGVEEDYRSGVLPPHLQRCAGPNRYFRSLSIPHGARVEVLACSADGALVACPQWPPAVVALGDLRVHLSRRVDQVATWFLVAAGVYWAILLVLAVLQARAVISRRDICRRCS